MVVVTRGKDVNWSCEGIRDSADDGCWVVGPCGQRQGGGRNAGQGAGSLRRGHVLRHVWGNYLHGPTRPEDVQICDARMQVSHDCFQPGVRITREVGVIKVGVF